MSLNTVVLQGRRAWSVVTTYTPLGSEKVSPPHTEARCSTNAPLKLYTRRLVCSVSSSTTKPPSAAPIVRGWSPWMPTTPAPPGMTMTLDGSER